MANENNDLILLNTTTAVFANENSDDAHKVNDTDLRTKWKGGQYPGYVETDLEGMCRIKKIVIHTPQNAYTDYAVFVSDDAYTYSLLLEKKDEKKCPAEGDVYCVDVTARYVRLLIEYNSVETYCIVNGLEIYGEKTADPCVSAHEIAIPQFSECEFNVPVTPADTRNAICGIIERNLGKQYIDWFVTDFAPNTVHPDCDYFVLSDYDGKIRIRGNDGVAVCAGLNHYLKYFCNVNISQVGCQCKMPQAVVPVVTPLRRETPFKVRYSYNYCALSYTMAFWGEEQWQKELDWLALQGVNVILDITAQEEVWRRFLTKLGYNLREIKSFITGPAYYAWAYMANIYGVGGPVHDTWFERRTALARKNQLFMRRLGMQPVLQAFSGMLPCDIAKKLPDAVTISQGLWNGLSRPLMLRTDTPCYLRLASLFYESQREVFGDCTRYFAADPFHEGGRRGSLRPNRVSENLLQALLGYKRDAVWIIQSWGTNPSNGLIEGIGKNKEHALVLDLYAEKRPRWKSWLGGEFDNTPWVWCMLNNFGGRMGLHGHIKTIANAVSEASHEAKYMRGIGITPEATHSNPVVYDLFFECAWSETPYDINPVEHIDWLMKYADRRYGAKSESARQAMLLLEKTVYNPDLNEHGEGAPESVVNARPALKIRSASSWGNGVVAYDKLLLEKAVRLLLEDYNTLSMSEGYRFDLADLAKQVLSNTAQEYQKRMAASYRRGSIESFTYWSERFIQLIKTADRVLSAEKEFLLGTWTDAAVKLADNTDDFTRKMYLFNAKALITTWAGGRQAANDGGLRDYSNKQWSSLTSELYMKRWQIWIEQCMRELSGEKTSKPDWFRIENRWTWEDKQYPTEPSGEDIGELTRLVLNNFSAEDVFTIDNRK